MTTQSNRTTRVTEPLNTLAKPQEKGILPPHLQEQTLAEDEPYALPHCLPFPAKPAELQPEQNKGV